MSTVVEGEKITLMKWGNAFVSYFRRKINKNIQKKVRKISKNENGSLHLEVELAVEDKEYKSTKKFGWISKDSPLVRKIIK